MAIKDEVRREQEKLKDKPFSYKVKYFFDYYKIPVIVVLFIIIFTTLLLKDVHKEKIGYRVYGAFVNAYSMDNTDALSRQFEEYLTAHAEDPSADTRPVQIDTSMSLDPHGSDQSSMTTSMKVIASIEANRLDFLVGNRDAFDFFARDGGFDNLELLMPEVVSAAEEDDLIYAPTYDEKIGVAGIRIKDSSVLKQFEMFSGEDCYFGIIANNPNLDNAPQFYYFLSE